MVFAFFYLLNAHGQATGDFRSVKGIKGVWNDYKVWEMYNGTSWMPATFGQLPTITSAVEIREGDALIINSGSLISGNLTVNGTLTYDVSTVSDLTVNGTVVVGASGSFTSPTSGKIVSHSLYIGGSSANSTTGGNLIVEGVFNMNLISEAGTNVIFCGSADNSIDGTGAINFYSLTVNKGSGSFGSILDIKSIITCANGSSVNGNRLQAILGTIKISSSSVLSPYYGDVLVNGATIYGRLWLNNPGAIVQSVGAGTQGGAAGNYTFSGITQLDAGTISIGTGNSAVRFTDRLYITGGTLNVYGNLMTGSSLCTMTNGNVNVYPQVSSNLVASGTSVVSFGSGTFTCSGGTFTITDPCKNAGTADKTITTSTGISNFTGSTLRLGDGVSDLDGPPSGFVLGTGIIYGDIVVNNSPSSTKLTRKVQLDGNTNIAGNLMINSGIANQFLLKGYSLTISGNISNKGSFVVDNTPGNGLFFNGSKPQTVGGTGIIISNINNLTVNNNSGANPAVDLQIPLSVSNSLTLINGSLGSSTNSAFTIGKSSTSNVFSMTRSGGSLAITPTYALGGVDLDVTYNSPGNTVRIITGNELPSATKTRLFTVNNVGGVILDKPVRCETLALATGKITTTSVNSLTVAGSLSNSIVGGSASSYVNGPLTRTIPHNAAAANYKFPVGKNAYRLFEFSSLTTGGSGNCTFTVEAFDDGSYSGTAGIGMFALNTDKYWVLSAILDSVSILSSNVRISEAGLTRINRIGQANSASGTYNDTGGATDRKTIASVATIDYSSIAQGTCFKIGVAVGNYAIGPQSSYVGYAGTFATLSAAVAFITTVPLSYNMIFEFQPDYVSTVETYPIILTSNISSDANATVTFRPAANVNSVINFSGSTSIITNTGANYIIFDGRNGGRGTNKYFQFTNTSSSLPVIALTGDTQYNQILYSVLKGSNNTTTGSLLAINASTNGNSFYTIDHCNFDASGLVNNGLYSIGIASDANITNNNFFDFRNGAGIYLAGGSDNAVIDNNNFYQTTPYPGFEGTTSGIIVTGGKNIRISNNNIGGSGPGLTGIWKVSITSPAAYSFSGINATSLTTTSKIYSNKIQKFDWNSTPKGTWTGINASGDVNVGTDAANEIGSSLDNGNIKITYTDTLLNYTYIYYLCPKNVSSGTKSKDIKELRKKNK